VCDEDAAFFQIRHESFNESRMMHRVMDRDCSCGVQLLRSGSRAVRAGLFWLY
jgi:hypothetical protein